MLNNIICATLIGLSLTSATIVTKTFEDVPIISIRDKDNFVYNGNLKGVIFIDEDKINDSINVCSLKGEPIKINQFGEYYYDIDDGFKKGGLYCSDSTPITEVNKLINNVKTQISTGEMVKEFSNIPSVNVGSGWNNITSEKLDATLNDGSWHYGDFSEWQDFYYHKDDKYTYYLIINQSYITPDREYHGKYRTSNIKYYFNDNSKDFLLRDYGPKMHKPEINIIDGFSLGTTTNSEGVELNADFSISYEAIINSPTILDEGNMSKDQVGLNFRYEYPWANSGQCYEYNINQTVQCTYYLIRENNINTNDTTALDKRIITMIHDSKLPWDDKAKDFYLETNYTLNK